MNQFKAIILRYPTRIKYSLIIINVFVLLIAVRMYINYVAIEDTIQDTINQTKEWERELAYSKNFLINYEKSKYAKYFLQHKNNILSKWEFIVKFEKMPTKADKADQEKQITNYNERTYITTPEQSRKQFISDKRSKIK